MLRHPFFVDISLSLLYNTYKFEQIGYLIEFVNFCVPKGRSGKDILQ